MIASGQAQSEKRKNTPGPQGWLFESSEFQQELYSLCEKLSLESTTARSLVVSGASGGEGTTTVALNLAYAFAQLKLRRTLLVDANLRKPAVHQALELPLEPGLSDWNVSEEPPLLRTPWSANLSVLTAGSLADDLAWEKCNRILPALSVHVRASFDVVIWDTPPIATYPDALSLARDADGVLLVAEADRTTLSSLADAREQITRVGGVVLGVVLNRKGRHLPKWLRR
ncbi:MAG: CpsD/CapB family tyrosine-protein kinase [Bryobacteraceae bacterium]|nr:CpsD/CapB family tyrosine-protein kinase [Bryobacteraceae bacterium]